MPQSMSQVGRRASGARAGGAMLLLAVAATGAAAGSVDALPLAPTELRLAAAAEAPAQAAAGGAPQAALAHAAALARRSIVKGAPYCADGLSESVQTLSDGNRIVRRTALRACRDADGRTRQEVETPQGRRIYIVDPVAGVHWVLDAERKVATRLAPGQAAALGGGDAAAWRDYAQRMREWARQLGGRHAAPAAGAASAAKSESVIISEVVTEGGDGARRDVRVNVIRLGDGEAAGGLAPPALLSLPGGPPLALELPRTLGARGPGVVSSLGSKEFDTGDGGKLRAEGKLTTWTIEAGRLGNERPIVITREVWSAPDLHLTLSIRESDPRVGETHYRLSNIVRAAPAADLFRPPEGYTLREPRMPPAVAPMPPAPPSPPTGPIPSPAPQRG
jgi:hypothetical protein